MCAGTARGQSPSPAAGLSALSRPELWSRLDPNLLIETGPRAAGEARVIADLNGPGCVYQIEARRPTGRVRFFFDGETAPRLECEAAELFNDRRAPFQRPFVSGLDAPGWCVFPIPFAKRLRIETDAAPDAAANAHWKLLYRKHDAAAVPKSFTPELDDATAAERDRFIRSGIRAGLPPGPAGGPRRREGRAVLRARSRIPILAEVGPGSLTSLSVTLKNPGPAQFRDVIVRAWWDGAAKPAVEIPVSDLGGGLFPGDRPASLGFSRLGDRAACTYPMPYRRQARLELENDADYDIELSWSMELGAPHPEGSGWFHAHWQRDRTSGAEPLLLGGLVGRGRLVGVALGAQGSRGLGFLANRFEFTAEGVSAPVLTSADTSGFFQSPPGFGLKPEARGTVGCTTRDGSLSRIGAYRCLLGDAVDFERGLKAAWIPPARGGEAGVDVWRTLYWYADRPEGQGPAVPGFSNRRPAAPDTPGAIEAERLIASGGLTAAIESISGEVGGTGALTPGEDGLADGMTLQFEAPKTGDYRFGVRMVTVRGHTRLNIRLDGKPAGGEIDLHDPIPGARTFMLQTAALKAGIHRISLQVFERDRVARDEQVFLDSIILLPLSVPGSVEAEALTPLSVSPGASLEIQPTRAVGAQWSGVGQLLLRASAPGDAAELEWTLPAAAAGPLRIAHGVGPTFGTFRVMIDGKEIGPTLDGYAEDAGLSAPVTLGNLTLAPGPHRLTLRILGRAPSSHGHDCALDWLHIPTAN